MLQALLPGDADPDGLEAKTLMDSGIELQPLLDVAGTVLCKMFDVATPVMSQGRNEMIEVPEVIVDEAFVSIRDSNRLVIDVLAAQKDAPSYFVICRKFLLRIEDVDQVV